MTDTRLQTRIVHFHRPFTLPQVDGVLPPGSYSVDEEHERIDSVSVAAFRRVATVLHLRTTPGLRESIEVDGTALDAALLRDAASDTDTAPGPASG